MAAGAAGGGYLNTASTISDCGFLRASVMAPESVAVIVDRAKGLTSLGI